MKKEITEDDKIYKMGIDPYEKDKPGKDGEKFELTFDESWFFFQPDKPMVLWVGAKLYEELKDKEGEFNKMFKDEIERTNFIPELPFCGQRYERENNKEEEN